MWWSFLAVWFYECSLLFLFPLFEAFLPYLMNLIWTLVHFEFLSLPYFFYFSSGWWTNLPFPKHWAPSFFHFCFGSIWSCCNDSLQILQPVLLGDCSQASSLVSFPNEGLGFALFRLPKSLNFLYQAASHAGRKPPAGLYCSLTVSTCPNYLLVVPWIHFLNDVYTCFVEIFYPPNLTYSFNWS